MIYSRVNFQDTYNGLQKIVQKVNKDIAFHNVKTIVKEASDAIPCNFSIINSSKNPVIKNITIITGGNHEYLVFLPYTRDFFKMNSFEEAKQKYDNEKAKFRLSSIRFA